ncbi:hypothetical protein A6A03_07695 [Chloroflexus islandicus]|uniref:Response regulatory domain-containing protein n=1 Tax=Chloroflexus islandicus TaxID=1707952 RepID=A0A178MIN2_9CHLR|nr:response regulator [Chloroflexus islandicus]OAN48459.1 hypothetical protein A6A03_07695 [Chloroflexus islandicus]
MNKPCSDPRKRARVLVINDQSDISHLIQFLLKQAREDEVTIAFSAQEGIDIVQTEIPDLILIDITMPKLSGFDTCSMLRAIPALQQTPILLFDCLTIESVYPSAKQVGATGFLSLPFDYAELLAARDALLRGETYYPLDDAR